MTGNGIAKPGKISGSSLRWGGAGTALLVSLCANQNSWASNEADEARKEVARQVARQISATVNKGVKDALSEGEDRSGGGSGDPMSRRGINTYASPTFTGLEVVDAGVDTEIYQMVAGGDTRRGNFIFGASGSYSRADVNGPSFAGGLLDFGINTYSITPYATYLVNRNLFVTAIAGYNRTQIEQSQNDGNGLFTDISIGYLQPIGNYVMTGKLGHRFSYFAAENSQGTASDIANAGGVARDDDNWENTYYISGDISYKWGNFTPRVEGRWEHLDPEDTPSGADDIDSAFLTAGIDYDVQDAVTVGLTYTTELTGRAEDHDTYYNQAGANVKVRF
ncbi:MAG TPA: autotransporter domain-containing protein [Methylococcaceae bacterium]|nr:autotransporter domain-containing protein [Methylococcaceae bacterium]